MQAASNNAINKTRTPVSAACLITGSEPIHGDARCNQLCLNPFSCSGALSAPNYKFTTPRRTGVRSETAGTALKISHSIQKCEELIPPSPEGANDGRAKCASGEYVPGSVDSVTTPSSLDEAQAESRHPITKEIAPHKAAYFFTEANVSIAAPDATPPRVEARSVNIKAGTKRFCAQSEARV